MPTTECFVHGCYPIQCSKCGGTLTPPILQKDKRLHKEGQLQLVKGCTGCRETLDITESWLDANKTLHTHDGCGGKMITILDPNTFKPVDSCFKCGADVQQEERPNGQFVESR
jgi:hypothetical protein